MFERLDIVLVSVHSQLDMPKARMTRRVLKALSHPAVDILAHPTGRQIRKRAPVDIDLESDAAIRRGCEWQTPAQAVSHVSVDKP